ncbi:alpha/beta fold hydrolase [Mesorhizobium sp. ORM6]
MLLLHGNGASAQDFATSGIFDKAAAKYRVLAFDRPGFGMSPRPAGRPWSAGAQADLIQAAAAKLGIERYVVVGHSWGAAVALEMARRHRGPSPVLLSLLAIITPTKAGVGTVPKSSIRRYCRPCRDNCRCRRSTV